MHPARSQSGPNILRHSPLVSAFYGMMCSMVKVPPEKSSGSFV